jgi:hypothetical protein
MSNAVSCFSGGLPRGLGFAVAMKKMIEAISKFICDVFYFLATTFSVWIVAWAFDLGDGLSTFIITLAIVTDGLRFIHRRRVDSGAIQNGETIRFFRFTLTQEQAIRWFGRSRIIVITGALVMTLGTIFYFIEPTLPSPVIDFLGRQLGKPYMRYHGMVADDAGARAQVVFLFEVLSISLMMLLFFLFALGESFFYGSSISDDRLKGICPDPEANSKRKLPYTLMLINLFWVFFLIIIFSYFPITPKEKPLVHRYDPHRSIFMFLFTIIIFFITPLLFRFWCMLYPRVRSILINQRAAC